MFGSLGGAEFILIIVLALLLFGPRKLPQLGRTLGKTLTEFRGAAHEFRSSLEREVQLDEVKDLKQGLDQASTELRSVIDDTKRSVVPREPVRRPSTSSEAPADAAAGPPADPPADPPDPQTAAPRPARSSDVDPA